MADRKYSVAEIDKMRSLLWERAYLAWVKVRDPQGDYEISLDRMGRNIEDQLRTYMLNGTDPSELEIGSK
jgi:hypothetical protein